MIEYKGYIGQIEFDGEANIFHGEVVNTQDVITFQGTSIDELRNALADSVECYLNFCKKQGKQPEWKATIVEEKLDGITRSLLAMQVDPAYQQEVEFLEESHHPKLPEESDEWWKS